MTTISWMTPRDPSSSRTLSRSTPPPLAAGSTTTSAPARSARVSAQSHQARGKSEARLTSNQRSSGGHLHPLLFVELACALPGGDALRGRLLRCAEERGCHARVEKGSPTHSSSAVEDHAKRVPSEERASRGQIKGGRDCGCITVTMAAAEGGGGTLGHVGDLMQAASAVSYGMHSIGGSCAK